MKNFIRGLIVKILSFESKKTLKKYNPYIIAITGNIGKTTSKDYIKSLLSFKYGGLVRGSEKSQNSEFGVNLTILGEKNAWSNILKWTILILKNFFKLFITNKYPKTLVLEVGADKPGDIKFITNIITPDMVVLTAFQESPTHGEFFINTDQHILEKKYLVDALKNDGIVVYNIDDSTMTNLAHLKKEDAKNVKIYSFGKNENANVKFSDILNLYNDDAEIIGTKAKIKVSIDEQSYVLDLKLIGIVGVAHMYSLTSAICVSVLQGLTKEEIQEAIKNIDYAKSRMRILDGKNKLKIIDDTYNSSPMPAKNAIEAVKGILVKGKKIAVLGHMAELGKNTEEEHFNIGLLASGVFDMIILSGRYNEFFLEGIREEKFDLSKVYMAEGPQEVIELINNNKLVGENDLILLKGSQSARLEKVVVQLLINPHDRGHVCRQDKEWELR